MRKTHPVNALKKLGIGLAFGAATIMSMPTSALACTQIYMGKNLTADGNTYYGRAEDFGARYLKHYGIEPAHEAGFKYSSIESAFEYTSNKPTYRYSYVRDHPSNWYGRTDAYSEAGINEKGVSCSATLSTSYNEDAEAADPIDEGVGLGEYSYASIILGESANAREGVELIGSLVDEKGVCTNDQIIIADNNETWLFATLSAHQWIAMKLADDVASLNPNIGSLNYDVDLNDTENCLHSKDIESMPVEKGFAEYTDGKFDVAKTYGESLADSGVHQWTRYVQGRDYFARPLTEGTDYEITTVKNDDGTSQKGAMVSEIQPLFFKPGKSGWSTFELIRAFGNRGEKVPGLNANIDGVYAIGSERNTEINLFQIRRGYDPEVATIQWEMLSRAAYSVAIPLYSALITEVSPYFSDQTVPFDHCSVKDVVYNEEPENSINYVLMDISSLCFENPDTLGTNVRAYLDALQNELIEQNKEVDAAMLAETTTEGRTALANKAGKAATENTYKKCKALLQEMRAYQKAENFDQPFTPSDLNTETNGLKESITYAQDALATDPVTPDQPGTPEQPGKPEQPSTPEQPAKPEQPTTKPEKPGKSDNTTTTVTTNKTNTKGGLPTTGDRFDGRMVAAFAIAGVAVISAGGYILYRRNKE